MFTQNKTPTEAAKKEYFERNFAWHAISESKGDLTANIDNAVSIKVNYTLTSTKSSLLKTLN